MKPPESDLDCERANLPFSRNVRGIGVDERTQKFRNAACLAARQADQIDGTLSPLGWSAES